MIAQESKQPNKDLISLTLITLALVAILLISYSFFGLIGLFGVLAVPVGAVIYFVSLANPSLTIILAVFFSALSGGLASFPAGSLPISFSGLFTIYLLLSAGTALLLRLNHRKNIRFLIPFIPLILFIIYYWSRTIFSPGIGTAITDFILFFTPVLIGVLSYYVFRKIPSLRYTVEKFLLIVPLIPIGLLVINLFSGSLVTSQLGFRTTLGLGIGPRPLALFLLPILSLYVANLRYSPRFKNSLIYALGIGMILTVIVTSLSRVASVIALVIILPMSFLRKIFSFSTFMIIILGGILLFWWLSLPQVQARFFPRGIANFNFDVQTFQSIDTQGRRNLWDLTYNHALQKPVFGHGTGNSKLLVSSTYPNLEHPHNDYLRVFNDTGLIGMVLFGLAWLGLIARYLKRWIIYNRYRSREARFLLAAWLSILAISISFITDNTMQYVFVMVPLFIIIALAQSVPPPVPQTRL